MYMATNKNKEFDSNIEKIIEKMLKRDYGIEKPCKHIWISTKYPRVLSCKKCKQVRADFNINK